MLGTARGRRFLDNHRVLRPQRGDSPKDIGGGHRRLGIGESAGLALVLARVGALAQLRQAFGDVAEHTAAARQHGEVLRVIAQRHQLRVFRPLGAAAFDVPGEHRRSGDEDRVVRLEQLAQLVAPGGQEAGEMRVVLGKGLACGIGRGPHRAAGLFGEADRLLPAVRIGDAGAEHQRRSFGPVEQGRKPLDAGRRRNRAQRQLRQRGHLALAVPIVDRDRDVARPHRRRERGDEGANQRQRHVLGARRFDRVLDVRPREFRRALVVEERIERQDAARLLSGGDDDRRVVAEGGEQVAERMPGPRGAVQVDQRRPARCAGEAVGHAHDDRLVQPHHVRERHRLEHRDLGAARVAEQPVDAEVLEDLEGGFADVGH